MSGQRAIGYVRSATPASVAKDVQSATLEIQDYCHEHRISFVGVLYDSDADAHRKFNHRPGGAMLSSMSKNLRARNLIVPNLWMAFKDSVDATRHLKIWRTQRIKLHILNLNGEPFVNAGREGRAFDNAIREIAFIERRNIRERILGSQMKRKVRGYVYGPTPFGYDREGTILLENDREQAVIRRMRKMYKAGTSYNGIARALQNEGIQTKKGKKWYASTVRNVIHNNLSNIIEIHD